MLEIGSVHIGRAGCFPVVEAQSGFLTGHKPKLNKILSGGGNKLVFRCEDSVTCMFSVSFKRSQKRCDNIKVYDDNLKVVDNTVWTITKENFCLEHSAAATSESAFCTNRLTSIMKISELLPNEYYSSSDDENDKKDC
jgi:hypothetical protein